DRFKLINDSLGHAAGDRLLETIAQRLKQSLRVTDTISRPAGRQSLARLGGDEFTVLLDTVRRSDDVARVAERLMNVIRQPIPFDGQALTTTASIGIVVADDSRVYDSANDLLRDADIAMYRAKAGGKNRYALFDKPMHDAAVARLTLETQLHAAIDRQELALEYQPIVCFKTGQVHGLEALLRWRRQGQLVSPMDFIPVAEDTGAILPIGRWAIEEAVRQMAQWRDRNPGLPAIRMAVNLSRKQLSDPKLVACLLAATQKHGIDPGQLDLEITESAVMDNSHDAMQMLHDLRATGAKISMDDFGVGYSSLACLQQFPVDVLKIDRSFIENLSLKHDAEAVIQAMLTLAHGLGLSVVAEGLEAAEQVELLRSLNCDYGQGYFFSRPMWAGDVERYLNEHAAKRAA
ncbi:MAG: putative bifunctional diguanylate cyclase/phosphodiesterase, partial [Tepidisphaeraceae bacterium]